MSSARDPLPAWDPRPRRGLAPREGSGAAGSVTAELALALPSVVLLLAVVLAAGDVVAGQIRCVDAARAGARAAAHATGRARNAASPNTGRDDERRRSQETTARDAESPERVLQSGQALITLADLIHLFIKS